MNDIQTIITERVDDIPLLLEQMQRMELATLIDHHFPAHGNWHGLSLGWVSSRVSKNAILGPNSLPGFWIQDVKAISLLPGGPVFPRQ